MRDAVITGFLEAAGWGDAVRRPLAGDASARRYERLGRRGASTILMDVPPETGIAVQPFLAVTAWLRGHGFSAPDVMAADAAAGLVLLEDLGEGLFAVLCAAGGDEAAMYCAAVDVLAALQALAPPAGDWTPPPYDFDFLMREVRLAVDWYLPAATGRAVPEALAAEYDALAAALLAPVAVQAVPVLRDYHAENLLWLPERAGAARVGLLDYQDMLVGHPAYDLVSLVGDVRRDVGVGPMVVARYLERTGAERERFLAEVAVLGAQRNLKILGLFTRLARRDGKARYVAILPRVWGTLQRDLQHPVLAPLAGFVRTHLPAPDAAVQARILGGGA